MRTQTVWLRFLIWLSYASGRVISIAFDLYLSGWFGEGEPAAHYASKIMHQLKLAAVGSKPVLYELAIIGTTD